MDLCFFKKKKYIILFVPLAFFFDCLLFAPVTGFFIFGYTHDDQEEWEKLTGSTSRELFTKAIWTADRPYLQYMSGSFRSLDEDLYNILHILYIVGLIGIHAWIIIFSIFIFCVCLAILIKCCTG